LVSGLPIQAPPVLAVLAFVLLGAALPPLAAAADGYAQVTPGRALTFPRDLGSHPDFRTEWWYVTGWLTAGDGEQLGFQITFFRTKPEVDAANPSSFAPRQLLIAHCALSDPQRARLWQDQRVRRAGLKLAEASENDTQVWIDDWSLGHEASGYVAHIAAADFGLQLSLTQTGPPMLNGAEGFSRKGPSPAAASYYYSVPHLRVTGEVRRGTSSAPVTGEAWFDHEWSSEYLDAQAAGWEWIGINLNDGAALMAFRIRGTDGAARWAGASLRDPDGTLRVFGPPDVRFEPQRRWRSPRTGTNYPVEWRVSLGARTYELRPLFDDQENDTRASTGAIYWEGAVRAYQGGRLAGLGYLELTGYGERLDLTGTHR
jgi:predicted secreted hydrolase